MTPIPRRSPLTRIAFASLCLFVFTLPFVEVAEIPGIALISKLAGLLAMATGVIAVVARRQVRVLGTIHVIMAGFILWSGMTLYWSVAPELTIQRIQSYLQLFVLVLLVWELCSEEKHILQILRALVLGTLIPSFLTLLAFLPGQQALHLRAASGSDPNSLAYILALSLPVAYYLILREAGPLSVLYRLQMSFAVCAILFSGSAFSLVAMVIGLTLMFWTLHILPARTLGNAFAVVVIVGGALLLVIPSSLWQHIAQESRSSGITLTSAINGGMENIHTISAVGLGAGSMTKLDMNSPFRMFYETGMVGVGCFVALLSVLVLATERMSGSTRSFWFTVLGVWMAGGCGLHWEITPATWLLFGLLAAHAACHKHEGVSRVEQTKKRNYYVEQNAEVWS